MPSYFAEVIHLRDTSLVRVLFAANKKRLKYVRLYFLLKIFWILQVQGWYGSSINVRDSFCLVSLYV